MFWKKKRAEEYDGGEPELKRPGRRIFGFQCATAIHMSAKALAKQLYVDLGVVAEHAMQLGLMDIAAAMKDPQEMEMLRKHLHEEHTIKSLVESLSQYDAEAAGYLREGQARQHHKEQAIRDLVDMWCRCGLDPRLIKEIVLQELQKRTEIMRMRAAQKS
jgi:hypothetical protein